MRLVREREQAGDDPVKTVPDAIEIGARVLDREQAGANAEFVKTEFERASREVEREFTDKARTVAEYFGQKVDEVFGEDDGQLAKELERLFGDGSSASVQNRVREVVAEALAKSREDLVRQFSAADDRNPLADFKAGRGALDQRRPPAAPTPPSARCSQKLGELQKELQALRDEKDKLEEVDAERERGTAKGRSFEEAVAEAVDAHRAAPRATTPRRSATSPGPPARSATWWSPSTPATGRRAAASSSRPRTAGCRSRRRWRSSTGRWPSATPTSPCSWCPPRRRCRPSSSRCASTTATSWWWRSTPRPGTLALEVGYRLARARVLMKRGDADGIDAAPLRDAVERALGAMDDVRKVKSSSPARRRASTSAYDLVEEMADRVRAHLQEIDALRAARGRDGATAPTPAPTSRRSSRTSSAALIRAARRSSSSSGARRRSRASPA